MPKEEEKVIVLDDFSGGLAENQYLGIDNSLFRMVGTDVFSKPGIIMAGPGITAEDTGFTSEVNKIVACSNGYFYFFCADGKIYQRESSTTYTEVKDIVPAIIDAREYNGYIYFATADALYRWEIGSAWTTVTDKWKELESSEDHPMVIQQLNLYIANNNKVAVVDNEGNWNSNSLDLNPDARITAMLSFGIDVLIGTQEPENKAGLYRWNCSDDSWNGEDWVGERKIWALEMENNNDVVYVFAGDYGNVYYYDGTRMVPLRKIPSDRSDGTWNEFDQYGGHVIESLNFCGKAIFTMINDNSNSLPASPGIYMWGSYGKDFQPVPVKLFDFSDLGWNKMANMRIASDGTSIVAAIRYSTDGGTNWVNAVYKINFTTKYNGSYFVTRALRDADGSVKNWSRVRILCSSMPYDCTITPYYRKKGDTDWTATSDTVTQFQLERDISLKHISTPELLLKFVFTTSGHNTPEIDKILVFFTDKTKKSF